MLFSDDRLTVAECAAFAERVRYAKESGRWVTIGGKEGEDGKHHGGSPVYIENGRITKGAPSLTGKKIDALKEEAEEGTHRQQLNQGRNYDRAKWSKKAREEGIKPEHLHQLAGELLAHDKAYKGDKTDILKDARQRLAEFSGQATTLHLHQDKDEIKGVDEVAADLAEKYGQEISSDDLMAMLHSGNPEPMTEAEALEEAYGQLAASKTHAEGDAKEPETVGGDTSFDFGENVKKASPRDATWQGNLFSDFKQSIVKQPKLFADLEPEEKRRQYLEGQKMIPFDKNQAGSPVRYSAAECARIADQVARYGSWNADLHPRDAKTGVFVEAQGGGSKSGDGPEAKLFDAPEGFGQNHTQVGGTGEMRAPTQTHHGDTQLEHGDPDIHENSPEASKRWSEAYRPDDFDRDEWRKRLKNGEDRVDLIEEHRAKKHPAGPQEAAAALAELGAGNSAPQQTKPPRPGFEGRRAKHQERAARHEDEFASMTPEEREAHKAERDAKAAVHNARKQGADPGVMAQLRAAWDGAKQSLGLAKKQAKGAKGSQNVRQTPLNWTGTQPGLDYNGNPLVLGPDGHPLGLHPVTGKPGATTEPEEGDNPFAGMHEQLFQDRLEDIHKGRHLRHQADGAPVRYSVEECRALAERVRYGRWVTLEDGQHVYVDGDEVRPSGPGGKADSPKTSASPAARTEAEVVKDRREVEQEIGHFGRMAGAQGYIGINPRDKERWDELHNKLDGLRKELHELDKPRREAEEKAEAARREAHWDKEKKRVAELPVKQKINGWDICTDGANWFVRDPHTKEEVYKGKQSLAREVAKESPPDAPEHHAMTAAPVRYSREECDQIARIGCLPPHRYAAAKLEHYLFED